MIGIMVCVTVVKFVLMVYCRRFKNEIVRAYAQDHLFDVVTNSVGLAAAVLAVHYYWWIDPTGAIIVSSYIAHLFLFYDYLASFLLYLYCGYWGSATFKVLFSFLKSSQSSV